MIYTNAKTLQKIHTKFMTCRFRMMILRLKISIQNTNIIKINNFSRRWGSLDTSEVDTAMIGRLN